MTTQAEASLAQLEAELERAREARRSLAALLYDQQALLNRTETFVHSARAATESIQGQLLAQATFPALHRPATAPRCASAHWGCLAEKVGTAAEFGGGSGKP